MIELTQEQQDQLSTILPKINSLENELQQENPNIHLYLKDINENLREFPDLVHLLSDEQIAPIYSAMRQLTGVAIAVKVAKKSKKNNLLDDGSKVADLL